MQGGFRSTFHWLLEVSIAKPLGTVSGTPYPGLTSWEPTLPFPGKLVWGSLSKHHCYPSPCCLRSSPGCTEQVGHGLRPWEQQSNGKRNINNRHGAELGELVGAVYQGLRLQGGAGADGETRFSRLGHRPGPDVNACSRRYLGTVGGAVEYMSQPFHPPSSSCFLPSSKEP